MALPTTVSIAAAQHVAQSSAAGIAPATAGAIKAPGEAIPAADSAKGSSTRDSHADPDTAGAVQELVDVLKTTSIGLRFEIDDKTHRVITKVIDKDTGELIRQMPTEEVLRVARAIDKLQGLFVSHAV
ncbi:flagellar protein FlaG [Cupriavidus plantarum]|uniref:Flagellar protein FlaG n=1 Tax=Cupriavidus plantarum TaxID=942865 RepID=A0A316EWN2_9BURK|nr:flagellar protein FlaG [Cupriavidus plantarum]PWK35559.1 flagellar protein FlaG [Cupriavidus plantarum]RLK39423.1 flagellar protein FlaG [Cupriavidus plantarum]